MDAKDWSTMGCPSHEVQTPHFMAPEVAQQSGGPIKMHLLHSGTAGWWIICGVSEWLTIHKPVINPVLMVNSVDEYEFTQINDDQS